MVTSYSDKVTHIIVANGVTVPQLMKTLGVDTLPASVTVVNENWFADCIEAGKIVGFGGKEVLGVPEVEISELLKPRPMTQTQKASTS